MKVEVGSFRQLRRLAPVLDDVLNAGEIEYADQAVNLGALATLCSQLFDTYRHLHPTDTEQARLRSPEPENIFPSSAQVVNHSDDVAYR
jgi:hypothetical protein